MTELTPRKIKRYGWRPDLPDARDYKFTPTTPKLTNLNSRVPLVDLRRSCPPVYDQGQVGSCTANAIAGAIQFGRNKQNLKPDFTPSRLFIYYNERVIEGTVKEDSGAMIRDGIKSVATLGAPPESDWLYLPDAQLYLKPSAKAYADALNYKAVTYQRISHQLNDMLDCIAGGYPFVFGFTVYESFESNSVAQTGIVPMPQFNSEKVLGGHAVMAVGYDITSQHFIVRNSWGTNWGMGGYCRMPFAYLTNSSLSSDFWTIRLESA